AEDGIRDRNVTGVQTCALPIFMSPQEPSSTTATMPAAQGAALSAQSNGPGAESLPEDGAANFDTTDQEKKRSPWFWPLIGVVILAALVGIGLWVSSLGSDAEPEPEPCEHEMVTPLQMREQTLYKRGT